MRVRIFELRLLAAVLTVLWSFAAGLVLVGYRPGGPIDLLVGLAACLTVPIPVAGLVWPPVARGPRAFAAVVWLGLGAMLLLVPSIGGILEQLIARGPQTLLPSVEAAYPWILALVATSLFAGLGVARRVLGGTSLRRARLAAGTAFAVGATLVVGFAFAGAAVANDLALRDTPAASSRFGPTRTDLQPPPCDGSLAAGPWASVEMTLGGEVDRRSIGTGTLAGMRSGADFRWTAQAATDRALGTFGAARVGTGAWTMEPRRPWQPASPSAVAGLDLDVQVVATTLRPSQRVAAEDRGLEFIEGARARHCRIAVDGPSFQEGFPEIAWLAGPAADLHRWRGQLDYWVFVDGQLGRTSGSVNGEASAVGSDGILGTISVTMTAVDRDRPVTIGPPPT
jgi:hypothetical protein